MVFNKCHVNKYNLYNQVGVIALNCMGEMYNSHAQGSPGSTQKMPANLYEQPTGQQQIPSLEEELNIDKSTMETLKALYQAKERAVAMENFDEAIRLKDTIERLKTVSGHIAQFEERKRIAIQNEDYESAKMIKMEIEKLKQSVMYPGFQPPAFPPQLYGQGVPTHSYTGAPIPTQPTDVYASM